MTSYSLTMCWWSKLRWIYISLSSIYKLCPLNFFRFIAFIAYLLCCLFIYTPLYTFPLKPRPSSSLGSYLYFPTRISFYFKAPLVGLSPLRVRGIPLSLWKVLMYYREWLRIWINELIKQGEVYYPKIVLFISQKQLNDEFMTDFLVQKSHMQFNLTVFIPFSGIHYYKMLISHPSWWLKLKNNKF